MSQTDIFDQLNNAVLDLQAADFQTYERPLKSIARLLSHPSLTPFNEALTSNVNLEEFLESNKNAGSHMGARQLQWPDEPHDVLGLTVLIIRRMAEDSSFVLNFSRAFSSHRKLSVGINAMTAQMVIPFLRDYKTYVLSQGNTEPGVVKPKSKRIFIVHGHDSAARELVARFIQTLELVPVILHEQANQGRTVIEKVEANSDVGFAVILLTPDDEGRAKGTEMLEPRARQNVLLELGYFLGKLGRANLCALKAGQLEIPSDFAGVVWERLDDNGGWRLALARELKAAGYLIDLNKALT